MKHNFNSKIFGVALIPFYMYVLISIFVFVSSGYQWDVFNPLSVALLSFGMIAGAVCFSFKSRMLHMLALCIFIFLGGIGVYVGLLVQPINYMELLSSALLIAFAFGMYEFSKAREIG